MTRVLISNRLQRDFAMVPNALWRAPLPFAAKGVAAYLLSLRDGAMPYVAEMESAMGIGRDARRKAFAALERVGFLSWEVERNRSKQIVAKTLVLDPLAFDRAEALEEVRSGRAPESQADGLSRAPEIPAGGSAVPAAVETRPCSGGKSGDTLRQDKTKRAARSRRASRPAPASPLPANGQASAGASNVAGLSRFQRSRLLAGQDVLVGSVLVKPGSPQASALVDALRNAEKSQGGAVA